MYIQQQGHFIHIFDGKVEIRKTFNNRTFMIIMEDERLLKLKEKFSYAYNSTHFSRHHESTFQSILLWHAIFGHINYNN